MKSFAKAVGAALASLAMCAWGFAPAAVAQTPDFLNPNARAPGAAPAAAAPAAAPVAAAPDPRARGMELAPAFITETKTPCALADATFRFNGRVPSAAGTPVATDFIEVVCTDDLGYIIARRADNTYFANDCLTTSTEAFAGPALTFKCVLPANAKPVDGLSTHVKAAGIPCVLKGAEAMGSNATTSLFEVSCENADGLVLVLANPRNARAPEAVSCYSTLGSPQQCKLTTREQTLAPIMALAGKATTPCAATTQRFVTRTPQGARYYEFKCPNNTGFMVEATATNTFVRSIACVQATGIAGGCKL